MKKLVIYFFCIILLIFAIPVIFTNKFKLEEVSNNQVIEEEIETYDYGSLSTIKLLHIETGEVEEIGLDEYLYGVVSAEMPANYELEALKAQALVARTYTIYKIKNGSKHENADICDSALCCQAWISKENRYVRWEEGKQDEYWQKIISAVNLTKGKYITYQNEPINALFHSNSGGMTELPINVWGGDYAYFQAVETSGEDAYSGYNSEVEVSKDELIQKMLEKYSGFEIDFASDDCIKILEYTESGRVKNMQIGNITISGVEARSIFGLKSSKFTLEIIENAIKFSVIGYGHGVGLSQSGSDALAKQGMSSEEIIKHYYKDVEISE